jgi:orotidine-5'-phosphate decarboxylase
MSSGKPGIILALDGLSFEESIDLLSNVGNRCYAAKMHDILGAEGEATVRGLLKLAPKKMWIDVKIHDIPQTAANRTADILKYGARIITANAAAGVETMRAVAHEVNRYGPDALSLASLLLTSLDEKEIERSHGGDRTHGNILFDLASMALEAGMGGIVCSPREVGMLKKHSDFKDMKFVAVSVRSEGADAGDQKRFGTPQEAVDNGADFIVVGRQVTRAKNSIAALNAITTEIGMNTRADSRTARLQSIVLH